MPFSKSQVITSMKSTGIVPMFYHGDAGLVKEIVDVCYQGGVRVLELTNRGANAFEVFKEVLKYGEKYSDLILGIGTILDPKTAEKYIKAGAQFVVAPILNPPTGQACREHDTVWMPGAFTLTEIVTAKVLGADLIKLFPASVLGPGFVSSVLPVVPDLQLVATGGVEPTQQSLTSWFKAGVVCAGMGSQLITKDILAKKDWPTLLHKVKDSITIIQQIRNSS